MEEWQTQKFRSNVIQKINEMLQSTGQNQDPSKNAIAMEGHIFKKSRTKDEYLGLVAKLCVHFKDYAQKKQPQQAPPSNVEMPQQNMMQDPLNALQNLASQGNRNPQMMVGGPNSNQMSGPGGPVAASNLLQTLNQQRPGQQQQQMQQMQGIRSQLPGPGQNQMMPQMGPGGGMQMNVVGPTGPGGVQQAQMVGNVQQMSGPMQTQMNQMSSGPGPGTGVGVGPNSGGNQMQMNTQMQVPSGAGGVPMNVQQMPAQLQQQMQQNQMNMGMNHPQLNQMMNVRMNQGGQMVGPGMQGIPPNMQPNQGGPMQVGAGMPAQSGNLNQMLNMQQKSMQPMQQPGGQMFPVNRVGPVGQQQFLRQSPTPNAVPSPSGSMTVAQQQAQLQQQQQAPQMPNPQMIPSPALVPTSSPQMSNLMPNQQQRNTMRQSPSAPLNTPGQVASNSPFNPQEDQLYREKYKQLTKYIEPLKRMVAKIGNDGTNVEKITKMSKLLEILSNPAQRVPLETLLKCEKALEKMEIVSYSGTQFGKSSNPLMDVISKTLQSPIANHTLHRTFRPSLELLFGTDICAPAPSKVARMTEKPSPNEPEIPHVLQGEIARLDQKFKITLDSTGQNNTKSIKLICCLDDKRLPSVPPVSINIPENYPSSAPDCSLAEQEYNSTPFLKSVQNALLARIAKLPKFYSLSHLLDTWEMSVRQACSPNAKTAVACELTAIFGM